MRYLLADSIIGVKAGEKIRGIKNIVMSEDFLEYHFPRNPVMPGMLLLEALVQLTGWLEAASSDFRNWFLLSKVRSSRFYGFSLPGDQVELAVELSPRSEPDNRVYTGIAMVEGKKKASAEFEGETLPFEEIEDIDGQRRFFSLLTRDGI
ncbi:MAG TPA: 3-hydroxyacyl-[acyl-carrier-protein] dehydratase FabZ [Nitrospiraceae bacterium]|jgi:3-hydroxymyristoyl/3-hydroxydecanoyl-(acyl carrier protein) dehydratase|nr:3-hydroxyacyl-[acyl-carrier-protein] dehydratase FabZ [Nitrospiraceae bacterium]